MHRYVLGSRAGNKNLVLRDQPALNWRAKLGDSLLREIPEPMVEFQLFETGARAHELFRLRCDPCQR